MPVHGGQNFSGMLGRVGERTQGADEQRNGHGGGYAFSAHLPDAYKRRRLCERNDLEEVAADLAVGLVDRLDDEPGNGRSLIRDEDTLHRPGGLKLRVEAL